MGKKVTEAIPGIKEANPELFEIYGRVATTAKNEKFEVFFKPLNMWLAISVYSPMKGYFAAVFEDISGRKNQEDERRKAEELTRQRNEELENLQVKLEEKSAEVEEYATRMEELAEERAMKLKDAERLAAVGATAGMVGHDIRNPLQAIMSDVYLAKSELISIPASEEKKNAIESLNEIEKNVSYINKIVQDLQDYSRPLKATIQKTYLETIISDLLRNNDFPSNIKNVIKINKNADAVLADPDLLRRIIGNLFNNAVQAMPDGGTLTIRTRKERKDIIITVEDTGVGIPEEAKPKLFTPLFTTKSKGQGFGLAVVKRMTEKMYGTVTFESDIGKGTIFVVRLPAPNES